MSIKNYLLICLLGMALPLQTWAQEHVQTVRGQITDAYTGAAIAEAKITIPFTTPPKEVFCDADGRFVIEEVPTGRLSLQVAQQGYEMLALPDLVLNQGKELVLNLQLKPVTYRSGGVSISVPALSPLSGRSISAEETKRFAAVYFDPARVAASMPGVTQTDDGANHLVVRGNSPNGVLWRLEGIDILNPNHLSNAGTFGDRSTAAGGGTNILSTQLLGNSVFNTGAFSAQYGNALGGVFDISLRPGNDQQYEFTAQAGFIGVDLSAEGPFSRNSKASFLVNYRYSFTGLLALMGVPLGDEDVRFQDLAFNLNFPTKKLGTFTVFGMGGLSSNRFTGQTEDSLVNGQKDRFNIDYFSNMATGGITHRIVLGERTLWKTSVGVSQLVTGRQADLILDTVSTIPTEIDEMAQSRISATTSLQHALTEGLYIKVGAFANRAGYDLRRETAIPGSSILSELANEAGSYWLVQPYGDLTWRPARALELTGGVHGMYQGLNGQFVLEPRVRAHVRIDQRKEVQLGYGLHSQTQSPWTYFAIALDSNAVFRPGLNRDLGLSRGHHFVANYGHFFGSHFRVRLEGYYQQLFDVPIVNDPASTFSALNLLEEDAAFAMENAGTGRNYGVELNVEQLLKRNFYFLLSGSLFRSLYTAGDGVERGTRYDGRFATATSAGYEWSRESRKGKQQVFGINLRTIFRGGFREMPIDLAASRAVLRTVYDDSDGFTEQLPNYFRTDIRFTFKRNRPGYTSTLGIDLQNVTNTRNVSFRYYDFQLDEIVTRYQLGLIPLLSYRMEF